jgi:hypothetical protein
VVFTYLTALVLGTGAGLGAPSHFTTPSGKPLTGFESAWTALHEFYGDTTPATFVVVERDDGPGLFNTAKASVVLSRDALAARGAPTLVHEGSHICLSRLTNGASELETLRFVDEGLATIFEHRLVGTFPQLEVAARESAAIQLAAGNLTLAKLARWSVYSGASGKRSPYAYSVGAAFDLYLLERFGEDRFKTFLRALGRERDLDGAASRALGESARQLEKAWLRSLATVRIGKPEIVQLEPRNGATAVPRAARELRVTFATNMSPSICVQTECGASNVCYRKARWSAPRELVIVPDGRLLPKHRYRIGLGIEGRCLMASLNGQALDPILWEFETE